MTQSEKTLLLFSIIFGGVGMLLCLAGVVLGIFLLQDRFTISGLIVTIVDAICFGLGSWVIYRGCKSLKGR